MLSTYGFPDGIVRRNPPANEGDARDKGLIPWVGKMPSSSKWQPTPVFCLENSTDRGACLYPWTWIFLGYGKLNHDREEWTWDSGHPKVRVGMADSDFMNVHGRGLSPACFQD